MRDYLGVMHGTDDGRQQRRGRRQQEDGGQAEGQGGDEYGQGERWNEQRPVVHRWESAATTKASTVAWTGSAQPGSGS
jgi:hypothetical protein